MIDELKDKLAESKTQSIILSEKTSSLNKLNEQLKKAVVKYKGKSEDLERRINDTNIKVWIKQDSGEVKRVNPIDVFNLATNCSDTYEK